MCCSLTGIEHILKILQSECCNPLSIGCSSAKFLCCILMRWDLRIPFGYVVDISHPVLSTASGCQ